MSIEWTLYSVQHTVHHCTQCVECTVIRLGYISMHSLHCTHSCAYCTTAALHLEINKKEIRENVALFEFSKLEQIYRGKFNNNKLFSSPLCTSKIKIFYTWQGNVIHQICKNIWSCEQCSCKFFLARVNTVPNLTLFVEKVSNFKSILLLFFLPLMTFFFFFFCPFPLLKKKQLKKYSCNFCPSRCVAVLFCSLIPYTCF